MFTDFRTEADFDEFQVSDSSRVIGLYSGDVLPAPILSTDNIMEIVFVSDDGVSRGGWKIEYKTSQEPGLINFISTIKRAQYDQSLSLLLIHNKYLTYECRTD